MARQGWPDLSDFKSFDAAFNYARKTWGARAPFTYKGREFRATRKSDVAPVQRVGAAGWQKQDGSEAVVVGVDPETGQEIRDLPAYLDDPETLNYYGFKKLADGTYLDTYNQVKTPMSASQVYNTIQSLGKIGNAEIDVSGNDKGDGQWRAAAVLKPGEQLATGEHTAGLNSGQIMPLAPRLLEVVGHRTHIKPNMSGYVPIYDLEHTAKREDGTPIAEYVNYKTENPIYKNTSTGEYYMVSPTTGEIKYSSPDLQVLNDKRLWTGYHSGYNGDRELAIDNQINNIGAEYVADEAQKEANRKTNSPLHVEVDPKTGQAMWMGQLSLKQFNDGQQNAVNNFASGAGNIAMEGLNAVNHALTGVGRMWAASERNKWGLPGEQYTWKDYLEGFGFKNGEITGFNDKTSIGLGDIVADGYLDMNPYLRTILNFANPEAAMSAYASWDYAPTKVEITPGKPQTSRFSSAQISRMENEAARQAKEAAKKAGKAGKNAGRGSGKKQKTTTTLYVEGNQMPGQGTTQGNNGIWTNGGSRTQHTWEVRPVQKEVRPTGETVWYWPTAPQINYTPGHFNMDTPLINGTQFGYDGREFRTEQLPTERAVVYDGVGELNDRQNAKLMNADTNFEGVSAPDKPVEGTIEVGGTNLNNKYVKNERRSQGRRTVSHNGKRSKRIINRQKKGDTSQGAQ